MIPNDEKGTMFGGWLYKVNRLRWWLQPLKRRYFVLTDTELRYYKHLDDISPAGVIKLKHYQNVQEQGVNDELFGFCLTSNTSKDQIILYTTTEKDRQIWIDHIQAGLKSLTSPKDRSQSNLSTSTGSASGNISILSTESSTSIEDEEHYNTILNKYLDKLHIHHHDNKKVEPEIKTYPLQKVCSLDDCSKKTTRPINSKNIIRKKSKSFHIASHYPSSSSSDDSDYNSLPLSPSSSYTPPSLAASYMQQALLEIERVKYVERSTSSNQLFSSTTKECDGQLDCIPVSLSPPPPRRKL